MAGAVSPKMYVRRRRGMEVKLRYQYSLVLLIHKADCPCFLYHLCHCCTVPREWTKCLMRMPSSAFASNNIRPREFVRLSRHDFQIKWTSSRLLPKKSRFIILTHRIWRIEWFHSARQPTGVLAPGKAV
jgi:hypothetical protein